MKLYICENCAKWVLGCELDGDFRRRCIANNRKDFKPKEASGGESSRLNPLLDCIGECGNCEDNITSSKWISNLCGRVEKASKLPESPLKENEGIKHGEMYMGEDDILKREPTIAELLQQKMCRECEEVDCKKCEKEALNYD